MAKTSRFGGIASSVVFLSTHPKYMAVYYINSYDIIHPDYQNYPPQVSVLLKKYGAEVLAVDKALRHRTTANATMIIVKEFAGRP